MKRNWSEEDYAVLRALDEALVPVKEIALVLDRTPAAVHQAKFRLGLSRRRESCPQCGEPIPPQTGPGRARLYCSTKCYHRAWYAEKKTAAQQAAAAQ